MADKAASALTAATAFAASDLLYAVVGGNSRTVTGSVLAAFLATATLAGGTLTDPAPMTLTQTWNDSADIFTALKVNVTDTAKASGSLLFDFQAGGVSKLKAIWDGGNYVIRSPYYFDAGIGFFIGDGANGQYGSNGPKLINSAAISWVNSANANSGTVDLTLFRGGPGILSQRNGAAAQASRIYNTGDETNGDWGGFDWQTTANILRVRSAKNGTGTIRPLAIDGYTKSGAPTASELPASTWGVFKDSGGGGVVIAYNDAGSIKSVALV